MFAYQRAVRKLTADPEPKRPYARPEPKSPRVRPGRGLDTGVWFGLLAVLAVALIVSFRHMAHLAERHGETRISALLIPVAVDGLVLVAALKLLADARAGRKTGRGLPWFTLILAGAVSLAANVAVAEPTAIGRMIGAWPPVAVILAWELTLRHIRDRQEQRDSGHASVTRRTTRHDGSGDSNRTTFYGDDSDRDSVTYYGDSDTGQDASDTTAPELAATADASDTTPAVTPGDTAPPAIGRDTTPAVVAVVAVATAEPEHDTVTPPGEPDATGDTTGDSGPNDIERARQRRDSRDSEPDTGHDSATGETPKETPQEYAARHGVSVRTAQRRLYGAKSGG